MPSRLIFPILVSFAIIWDCSSLEVTTSRLTSKQKIEPNLTSYDVLDIRTPPRIKIQNKTKIKNHENSHPGVAIPLDADSSVLEESTNKSDTDKSTTTWILLSGKQSLTTTIKPTPLKESTITNKTVDEISNLQNITLEAKDASINLETESTTKKNSNKKKKNKNRRRKPANKTSTTNLNPIKLKDVDFSNQIYSYLSRQIVPTLGVGLVGLVVTAGLASYFLYPFGVISRSDIDRKDNKASNHYHYRDKYSGGIPEEEAIGEVIAGMQGNLFLNNFLKTSTNKNPYLNKSYRNNKYSSIKGSVENVPFAQISERVAGSSEGSVMTQNESDNSIYAPTEKPFLTANTGESKMEKLNPVKMSEHGPRSLRN